MHASPTIIFILIFFIPVFILVLTFYIELVDYTDLSLFLASSVILNEVSIKAQAQQDIPIYDNSAELTDTNLKVEVVVTGLERPTNMVFLSSGEILVIEENNGTVRKIVNGNLLTKPLLDIPVSTVDNRGLLGIAKVEIQNKDKEYVFLYYTTSPTTEDGADSCVQLSKCNDENSHIRNLLVRYELSEDGNQLINRKVILELPAYPGATRTGGEVIVGPDKNLYLLVGDMSDKRGIITNDPDGKIPIDGRGGILAVYRL